MTFLIKSLVIIKQMSVTGEQNFGSDAIQWANKLNNYQANNNSNTFKEGSRERSFVFTMQF